MLKDYILCSSPLAIVIPLATVVRDFFIVTTVCDAPLVLTKSDKPVALKKSGAFCISKMSDALVVLKRSGGLFIPKRISNERDRVVSGKNYVCEKEGKGCNNNGPMHLNDISCLRPCYYRSWEFR